MPFSEIAKKLMPAVSYICFTTHGSVNCGRDTCRGSPRGSAAATTGRFSRCLSLPVPAARGRRPLARPLPRSLAPTVLLPARSPARGAGVHHLFSCVAPSRCVPGPRSAERQGPAAELTRGQRGTPIMWLPPLTNIKDVAFCSRRWRAFSLFACHVMAAEMENKYIKWISPQTHSFC